MPTTPHETAGGPLARSGRITAAILLVLSAVLALATSQIEYAFSSDPLGPRAFPYLLSAALGACAIWYFLRPGEAQPWPESGTLVRAMILIAVTAISVALMNHTGFLFAAFIMCTCAAYLFGASPIGAAGIGAVQAAFWYALFKYALGTYLPPGSWFFPG